MAKGTNLTPHGKGNKPYPPLAKGGRGDLRIIFEAAEVKRKKEKSGKSFNPEKYKMTRCPHCKGTGKSPDGDEEAEVCSQCGGFGWIKKEGEDK